MCLEFRGDAAVCREKLNDTMTPATVIVVERRPRWTPELQRQFINEDVRVRSVRSTADVLEALERTPKCVVLLDFDSALAECLQFLGRWIGPVPFLPIVVVGSQRTASLEWVVRDLGALEFFADVPAGEDIVRLCRRQWTQYDSLVSMAE